MPLKSLQTENDLTPYDDTFYKKRAAWRSDYKAIADWIDRHIVGQSFGDIGCGNAQILTYLHKRGKKIWGVDAVKAADHLSDKGISKYVQQADVAQPQHLPKSDVVLCLDVADRLDEKHADALVKNIVTTDASTILFTASKPGQAGIFHINLQPRDYWLSKFKKHKYYLDAVTTEDLKRSLSGSIKHITWYLEDIVVLRRLDNQSMVQAYAEANSAVEALTAEVAWFKKQNQKLKDDLWLANQQLKSILGSKRWTATSKIIRMVKP